MKVLKFGGTSVGSPQRMKEVCNLVLEDGQQKLVVLSAMSGTTNSLVEISQYLYSGNEDGAADIINKLHSKYLAHLPELYSTEEKRVLFELSNSYLSRLFLSIFFTCLSKSVSSYLP